MKKGQEVQFYPVAMTIAGADSGGGAGIAADLRTFNALGVFGCCAITAVTAQNPSAVTRIDPIDPAGVTAQIDAVLDKIAVRRCKSGMLFSAATVSAVAASVKRHKLKLVCDPVMVSTSGSKLMQDDAVAAMRDELLPLAEWITPNLPEGELLLGRKIADLEAMKAAAAELSAKFGCSVLLKGGHDRGEQCVDVVAREGKLYTLSTPRLNVPPLAAHGTGCTLSAALAATLTLELPWKRALCESRAFVFGSLGQTVHIGDGVEAMYPPVEDSFRLVRLAEV